ncbi:MAG: hypothetical protein K1X50_10475 [Candidatus Promineofilum sp.]|nr:hypothetical protein [Promineifilum sp.]
MLDWETIGTIVTALGVIIAVVALAYEIKVSRDERRFDTFVRFLDAYSAQQDRRRAKWQRVKDALQHNERIADEIDERKSIVDYLVARSHQLEPMYPVEHQLLEEEIGSLNIVNELCRLAMGDENRMALLGALFSSEISYYQNKLTDIQQIRDQERQFRLFSVVRYSFLIRFDTESYFDQLPR